jgi:hypothetical protein
MRANTIKLSENHDFAWLAHNTIAATGFNSIGKKTTVSPL